jgi:hypothetical protein
MELFMVRYDNFKLEAAAKKLALFYSISSEESLDVYAMADP